MARIALRLAALASLCFSISIARADVMFSTGTVSQPNEQQINMTVGATGNTLDGTTSGSNSPVTISSQNDILEVFAGGSTGYQIQTAGAQGSDTSLNDVTISLTRNTFSDLLGSVYGVFAESPTVDFTVWTTDSNTPWTWSFTGDLTNGGNEDNFFSIYATNNEQISSVLITGKFYELENLYVSGVSTPLSPPSVPVTTPEPASMMLLGAGLLGLCGLAKKRV